MAVRVAQDDRGHDRRHVRVDGRVDRHHLELVRHLVDLRLLQGIDRQVDVDDKGAWLARQRHRLDGRAFRGKGPQDFVERRRREVRSQDDHGRRGRRIEPDDLAAPVAAGNGQRLTFDRRAGREAGDSVIGAAQRRAG